MTVNRPYETVPAPVGNPLEPAPPATAELRGCPVAYCRAEAGHRELHDIPPCLRTCGPIRPGLGREHDPSLPERRLEATMIREVPMYRVECDAEGCDDSPQEASDFYAWAQQDAALDEAGNADWYVGEFGEFCFEHAPRCPCGARIHGDPEDEDGLCEDCQEAAVPA